MDRRDLPFRQSGQTLQVGILLFYQFFAECRSLPHLLFELGEDALAMLFLLGIFADQRVEDVLTPVDGHAQSEGDVALQSVLHA